MTLLRAASRTLLASYFVSTGYQAVRNPDALVAIAQPVADRVVPLVKQYAPAEVAGFVPEDAKTLVRVNGIAQVLGGLALASGKGRRLGALLLAGSLVPSTIAKYPFWSVTDAGAKADARVHFTKNLSLLGGVLLAAGDTEGKPSLVWRAQKGGEILAKDTRRASKRISRATGLTAGVVAKNASDLADTVSKGTSQLTDGAMAGGAALVGAAVASTRKARRQAAAQLKQAQAIAAKQAKKAQKKGAKEAKAAQKRDQKRAAILLAKDEKRAAAAQKKAARATRTRKNIQRGEN